MVLEYTTYREKLKGCFIGKTVGGTLGMPLEGYIGTREITYYDPVPTQMIANDDLDLQVVWLEVLRTCGLPVNRYDLAQGWLAHMRGLCDEYGVVMRNLNHGLYPPLSGSYDNKCTAGMGSVIRTEIWAALAPGDPDLAVKLALEDACCDHADDGVDATAFMAALESMAYTSGDIQGIIDAGMKYIPESGRVAKMLRDTLAWWKEKPDPLEIRKKILDKYFVINWTDVGINLSWILIGLLDGEQEKDPMQKISRGICTAVGLGHDADCTGATLGALFGILYPNHFEKRWTDPIGDTLVLSSCIVGMHETDTIASLCDQIADACRSVGEYYRTATVFTGAPETWNPLPCRYSSRDPVSLYRGGLASDYEKRESLVAVSPYTVRLRYPEPVAHSPEESLTYTAVIANPNGSSIHAELYLTASDGWSVAPAVHRLDGTETEITFMVKAPARRERRTCVNWLYLDFRTDDGLTFRSTAGLLETIPVLCASLENNRNSDGCPEPSLWQNGTVEEWNCHYHPVSAGGKLYVWEARVPHIVSETILIVQASRPVKVWRDGELILRHDGTEVLPVYHRVENNAHISMTGEWSRFVVYVAPECHTGENDCPFTAYARVPGCPTPYEQRKLYDRSFGKYEDGELFIGFGQRTAYAWIHELEWRIPQE